MRHTSGHVCEDVFIEVEKRSHPTGWAELSKEESELGSSAHLPPPPDSDAV